MMISVDIYELNLVTEASETRRLLTDTESTNIDCVFVLEVSECSNDTIFDFAITIGDYQHICFGIKLCS